MSPAKKEHVENRPDLLSVKRFKERVADQFAPFGNPTSWDCGAFLDRLDKDVTVVNGMKHLISFPHTQA